MAQIIHTTRSRETFPLVVPKWIDLKIPMVSAKLAPGKEPSWVSYKGSLVLAFSDQSVEGNEEKVFVTLQLPDGYKAGTDIEPHFHWVGEDASTGNVRWKYTCSWSNVGDPFPTETILYVDSANASTLDEHSRGSWAMLDGTGKTANSILLCSITRNSSHANDTFDGKDAYLFEFDFHYQIDDLGTLTH